MPTFAFWYAVFLLGGAVGVTAGSSFGSSLALIVGLVSGMALSGWAAQKLSSNGTSVSPNPEKPLIQPTLTATQASAEGVDRIRFASAHLGVQEMGIITAIPDTFGSLSLPKGMYEFAMRKLVESKHYTQNWIPTFP